MNILSKWKEIGIAILVLIVVIQTKRMNLLREKNSASQSTVDQQAKEINMLKDDLARIRISGGRVIYLTRTVAGGAISGHSEPYKPPEGNVDIGFTATAGGLPQIVVHVQNKGLTFRLGMGALYSTKIYPELDIKWAFWDRYSLKTGITTGFVDVGISRHVDDLIPFLNLQNLEIQAIYGKSFDWVNRLGIGIRTNL